MTTQSTTQADPATDPQMQLPALVEKARNQLNDFLKAGAHILCPLEVTDPPPGYFPKVVCVKINPDPVAKEVYVKEAGFGNRPAQLELTKIALMKLADMIGVSWDAERSKRLDDGRDPACCTYKAVGYIKDYLGHPREIEGTKHVNLDAIKDDLVATKTRQAETYQRKMGTKDEKDIPSKWLHALKAQRVDAFIHSEIKGELLKKRLFLVELAETGAKLRAIRSKGIRTTYTAQELGKAFADVRMVQLPGTTRPQAEAAYDALYGKPPARPEPAATPEETVIDAKAQVAESETNEEPQAKPSTRESILMDFEACEHSQQVEMVLELAQSRGYPVPLKPQDVAKWTSAVLRNVLDIILQHGEEGGGK